MKKQTLFCLAVASTALLACGRDASEEKSKTLATLPVTGETELILGNGLNVDTEDRLENCMEVANVPLVPADGQPDQIGEGSSTAALTLDVRSLSTYEDIDRFTNTSVSASVKGATYSGSFSYNGTEIYALTADNAVVGIQATADYGRWYFQNPQLKQEYKAIYDRNPEEFFRRCGTEYVSGYRLGQGVSVLLSTASRSQYSYEKISMDAKASADFGAGSGSVSASFLNVASSLLKLGSLNVKVRAYGAGGINTLEKLIKAEADVKSLAQEISQIVGAMKPNQATRYVLLTSPYPGIDYKDFKYSPVLKAHRRQTLINLFSDYRKLSQDLNRATTLSRNLPALVSSWGKLCDYATAETGSCSDFVTKMDAWKVGLQNGIAKIDELTKQCSAATKIDDCKSARTADLLVGDLMVKQWEQQYKNVLILAFLKAHQNP